jgi:cyclopropane-fatty-acyl-phospholipid synthase
MTRHSRMMVEHAENIGDHYALTLAEWRRRFLANREAVTALGFDRRFQRKWIYYLSSCEAGFRERVLGNLQLVMTREGNTNLRQIVSANDEHRW